MIDGSALLSPDWKAVATNAVSFVVAVVLLKRFAWSRITGFLEARTRRIESGFREIDEGRSDLEEREKAYAARMASIEEDARFLRQREIEDGRRIADKLLEAAKAEKERIRMDVRQEMEISKQMAEIALRRDLVEMSLAAAEKLVRTKLDSEGHRRFVEEAIEELSEMKPLD